MKTTTQPFQDFATITRTFGTISEAHTTKQISSDQESLDNVSIVKASQALSGEIVLENLLGKLIKILVENAGAQRGVLAINSQNVWKVMAQWNPTEEVLEVGAETVLDELQKENQLLPLTVFNFVRRAKQYLVIDDIEKDTKYSADNYFQYTKIQSLLCLPILKQNELVAILYVENSLSKGAFHAKRVEVLKLLASQAAISIENATLYNEMENRVLERTIELNNAYTELDDKNTSLTESINYAKRIQDALLPTEENVKGIFSENLFLFYKPRDIVSGDFYWVSQKENLAILAVVDCTGHGVPGAFMSLIGHNLLDAIVNVKNITTPHLILQELDNSISNILKQDYTNNRDGMDLTICVIDKANSKLLVAASKHSFYYFLDQELHILKGSKKSVGGSFIDKQEKQYFFTEEIDFSNRSIACYMTSDGYQDQFGGKADRKFLVKKLKELLVDIQPLGMEEQKQVVKDAFLNWKGKTKQTDDVLLIGFQFKG
jgi:histidine kinase